MEADNEDTDLVLASTSWTSLGEHKKTNSWRSIDWIPESDEPESAQKSFEGQLGPSLRTLTNENMTFNENLNQIPPGTLESNWRVDKCSSILTRWILGRESNPIYTLKKTKYDILDDLESETTDAFKHFNTLSSVYMLLLN